MTRGTDKDYSCRFGCGKNYHIPHFRNNHETHCLKNPSRGCKVLFEQVKKKWLYKGVEE